MPHALANDALVKSVLCDESNTSDLATADEGEEIDPLDAFMMGNNAAGAVQQQQRPLVKPDPDTKAGPSNRPPLAGGVPAMNGKAKRAPARRGKRSMYDTDSSSSEDEEEEEVSDDEDDEVCFATGLLHCMSSGFIQGWRHVPTRMRAPAS